MTLKRKHLKGFPSRFFFQPTVTKGLVENCPRITEILNQEFGTIPKYKHKFVPEKDQDALFKMVTSNLSKVVESLDIIRSHPK